jgi:CO dehydrogenase/acetyl-CoA synthase beta subunit
MAVFDLYIKKVEDFINDLGKKGRSVKSFKVPSPPVSLIENMPVKVGKNASQGIILRQDTFVELGNPEAGSSAFMLLTDDISLINDGKITLIGPDISESGGKSLPFGQIVIIGGKELADKDHESLQHSGFVGDQIEGYMVRSLPQNIWSRVSKDAAIKGFDFESLGKALMSIYKEGNSKIEAMEIVFITSSKEDIKQLEEISVQVQKISREIVKENWKIKGYDIDCVLDCDSCQDKPVCDDIREVLQDRKKKGLVN